MQAKAHWLLSRKEQILNEMAECEKQSREIVQALSAEVNSGRREVAALRESMRVAEQTHRQQISKFLIQIKTLEGLIVSKDDAFQQLKTSHSNLLSSSEQKNTANQQYYARLLELEHLLTVQKSETERLSRQHQRQLQKRQEFHMQEALRLKKDYEEQFNTFQMNTKKAHQQELAQLKRNNLLILQKLQEEHQANFAKNSETSKKTELDCGRLVTQNNRLLSVVNENKLRIMTLQSSLASQTQQTKLLQKQLQIFKDNSQREIVYLKQEKTQLSEKCRKMADKVEQLTWTNRQNQINKANEMQRIRKEVDQTFKQVLAKAQEERNALEVANSELKASLKSKMQELQKLQQASLKTKEKSQAQQKQMLQLKHQKQFLQKQAKSIQQSAPIKLNEQLKKELIRKDCEIQVLHQEIKRLKAKVNTASAAQQQFTRVKETLLQQNKMLLAEVNFLKKEKYKRDRNESKMSRSNFLSDVQSERSRDDGELEQYKKVIEMMTTQMNQVVAIIKEKEAKIEKLEALVKRLQRQLRDGK